MADARTSAKTPSLPVSPYTRSTSSPLTHLSHISSRPSTSPICSRRPTSWVPPFSRPTTPAASLLGYTPTIRTISPQIANFRLSPRDVVKAIAPHVLDERQTRRRSPSRPGYPPKPRKTYYQQHHYRNMIFSEHAQHHYPHNLWSESGIAHNSGGKKKKLGSSPLRVATVICWDNYNEPTSLRELQFR